MVLGSTSVCKVDRVWIKPDTEDDWEIMVLVPYDLKVMKVSCTKLWLHSAGVKSRKTSIIPARPNGDSSAGSEGCDVRWFYESGCPSRLVLANKISNIVGKSNAQCYMISSAEKLNPSCDVGRLVPMTEVLICPKLRADDDPTLPHEAGDDTDEVLLRDGFSILVNLPLPHEDFIVRLAPLPGNSLS